MLAAARAQALRDAADALELQPPKLKAVYVGLLRLYADEPWRLEPKQQPTMADVLVAHQRHNLRSCLCGWDALGKSHAEHQAAMLVEAGFGEVE